MGGFKLYKKIWGLDRLKKLGFPYPPYQVIDISNDRPIDNEKYVLKKISQICIPRLSEDRIGVTIRVSLPGSLDKFAKHGGLHVIEESDVVKRVLNKYEQYKPDGKIIIQHTVDARCSGTILKENGETIVETVFGDAPPLLEGQTTDYETWIFSRTSGNWRKEKIYKHNNKEVDVLTPVDLQTFEKYIKLLIGAVYLEWSISKSGKLYFYEYLNLKTEHSRLDFG
jgi:hypothetical protein